MFSIALFLSVVAFSCFMSFSFIILNPPNLFRICSIQARFLSPKNCDWAWCDLAFHASSKRTAIVAADKIPKNDKNAERQAKHMEQAQLDAWWKKFHIRNESRKNVNLLYASQMKRKHDGRISNENQVSNTFDLKTSNGRISYAHLTSRSVFSIFRSASGWGGAFSIGDAFVPEERLPMAFVQYIKERLAS